MATRIIQVPRSQMRPGGPRPNPEATIPLYEIGETGVSISGGRIRQSRLRNFQGARRSTVIREMAETDGTVKGALAVFVLLAQSVELSVTSENQEAAEFIDSCLDDMEQTRSEFVGAAMTMLPFGFSVHEKVFKQRLGRNPGMATLEIEGRQIEIEQPSSAHDDGRIGWRGMPIRSQDTISKWDTDPHGRVHGAWQRTKNLKGARDVYIPENKVVHFRTSTPNESPEGTSILEAAYRAWFFKRHFEDQMGVGVKRDLTGFPVMSFPDEDDIWSDAKVEQRKTAEKLVASIFRDEFEGLVKPNGVKLELISSPGQRQFDLFKVFQYLRLEILIATLTDFLAVGHEGAGSFALRKDARMPFMVALQGMLGQIEDQLNRDAIPQLLEVNNIPLDPPVEAKFGSVDVPSMEERMESLLKMAQTGMDVAGNEIRDPLLTDLRLPIPTDEGPETPFQEEAEDQEDDDDENE